MTQRITVLDDLDNALEADRTVAFAFDGVAYEIDLTKGHIEDLRAALAPYLAAARKVGTRAAATSVAATPVRKRRKPASSSAEDLRAWARAHGFEVRDRGRVSAEVKAAFAAR